jgi:AcrR family transcriptional regulator
MATRQTGKSSSKQSPRERIIEAAERIFSIKGLHGASLREIARASNVNVNLIPYHFKDKAGLFVSVMDSRASQINGMREKLLEDLDAKYSPGVAPVGEIIRALLRPIFVLRAADPDIWTNYVRAYMREIGTPVWHEVNDNSLAPVMKRFTTVLHRSMPSARRGDVLLVIEMGCHCQLIAADRIEATVVGETLAKDINPGDLENQLVRALVAAAVQFS